MTKNEAMSLGHGWVIHHKTEKNSDGTPLRCRVSGVCKVWKTRPEHFQLPVKYGLKTSFYITHENADDWELPQ